MPIVVLGLGSNLGDRIGYLRKAIRWMRSPESGGGVHLLAVSPIYESDAMMPEQAPADWNQSFLNLCVLGETALNPLALLDFVKKAELQVGRQPRVERWAPREIDIDILALGALAMESDRLVIPHRGLLNRPFVLLPLSDLLSDWRYPKPGPWEGRTASDLSVKWKSVPASEVPFRTHRTGNFLVELAGILNVTPDSFSDGGAFLKPENAIRHAVELVTSGAEILDIGAESTRPGAKAIDPEEEWSRLQPVLQALDRTFGSNFKSSGGVAGFRPIISVDTRNAEVARRSIDHGVNWINDVSGGINKELINTVAGSSADYVLMHSLGVPPSRDRVLPTDRDPVDSLLDWAEQRLRGLEKEGLPRSRVILDPGLGFGKTPEQSLTILRGIHRFHALGTRLLVGHSRKSFMKEWTDSQPIHRDLETALVSGFLAARGVDYLRVHDVGMSARVLRTEALLHDELVRESSIEGAV